MRNTQQNRCGFTLIELIITTTIFLIFIAVAGTSYLTIVEANAKANQAQKLYSEVRSVLDTAAAMIRAGSLDYSCIDRVLAPLDSRCVASGNGSQKRLLRTIHSDGLERRILEFSENNIFLSSETRASTEQPWTAIGPRTSLLSPKVRIEQGYFTIFPLQNPYEQSAAAIDEVQYQPTVTITMKIGAHEFTTTYASRSYGK
jgi:prepilin-type N-terminal cleavage/methylation domain-containing protein